MEVFANTLASGDDCDAHSLREAFSLSSIGRTPLDFGGWFLPWSP